LLVAEAAKSVAVMVVVAAAAAVVFYSDGSEDEVTSAPEPKSETEVISSESTTVSPSMLVILD